MTARHLSVLIFALFVTAGLTSLPFPPRARVYPLWVAVLGSLIVAVAWIRTPADEMPSGPAFVTIAPYLAWVIGFLMVAALVGLPLASALFVGIFLNRVGEVSRVRSAVAGVAAAGVLILLGAALGLRWPWAIYDVARVLGLT